MWCAACRDRLNIVKLLLLEGDTSGCIFSQCYRVIRPRVNRQAQSRLSTFFVTPSATAASVRYGHHTPKPQRCYNCPPGLSFYTLVSLQYHRTRPIRQRRLSIRDLGKHLTMTLQCAAPSTCGWSCKLTSRQVDMFLCSKQDGCGSIRDASCVPADDLCANHVSVSMPTAPPACLQPTRSSKFTAGASSLSLPSHSKEFSSSSRCSSTNG